MSVPVLRCQPAFLEIAHEGIGLDSLSDLRRRKARVGAQCSQRALYVHADNDAADIEH